jgi:hypothetical protein
LNSCYSIFYPYSHKYQISTPLWWKPSNNGADKFINSKFKKDFGVIIYLYVDDMLIFSINMNEIVEIKRYLTFIFKIKDLCEVNTLLGIKFKKHSSCYILTKYLISLSISI